MLEWRQKRFARFARFAAGSPIRTAVLLAAAFCCGVADAQLCDVQAAPGALTEETAAYLSTVTELENPLTEGEWLDLYVSSQPGGHFPLGDNGNDGESPDTPLRDFHGLQAKLDSLSDRCGVRVNLDWGDDFSGADVRPLDLDPTCSDPDHVGVWLRSSLPGARVVVDCHGWTPGNALFSFRDDGSGDGGWGVVENVHVEWCDADLFSARAGQDAHGLVLNSGGNVDGGHQILTSHSARGVDGVATSGNELVAINSYGATVGEGVAIQPGAFGKITAVGNGTFRSVGTGVYGSHGTINVVGHYFTDLDPLPPIADRRRMFKYSPTAQSSHEWLHLNLVNVGARTESDSPGAGAFYTTNSNCEATGSVLDARIFKTTFSGWDAGYAFSLIGCPSSYLLIYASACVDLSDNWRMVGVGDGLTTTNLAFMLDNSIWDDDPGGKWSWKFDGTWYANKAQFDSVTQVPYITPMEDAQSVELGGPGVDGTTFDPAAADPSLWIPSAGVNPDSVAILPSPGKPAYGTCQKRFQTVLDPKIPAFVTRRGVAIDSIDMNRCGGANVGYH